MSIEREIARAFVKIIDRGGEQNTRLVADIAKADEREVVDFCRRHGIARDGMGVFSLSGNENKIRRMAL